MLVINQLVSEALRAIDFPLEDWIARSQPAGVNKNPYSDGDMQKAFLN